MTDGGFETTNINLAAAVLCQVPGAVLAHIAPTPTVDGKKLIALAYPPEQYEAVCEVAKRFNERRLLVALYDYNKALNVLRDHLHETAHRRRDEGWTETLSERNRN